MHERKDSSHKRGSSGSRSSSAQRECSRRKRCHYQEPPAGSGSESALSLNLSLHSTLQEEDSALDMLMQTFITLRSDMEKLKEEKSMGAGGRYPTASAQKVGSMSAEVECLDLDLDCFFSGFKPSLHHVLSYDNDAQGEVVTGDVLHCAKAYGPLDDVSADIDKQVVDMVNHVFNNSLWDNEYKEILGDDSAKRLRNCCALVPVECNSQVLEALKLDAKKADFCLKEVSKDIIKAAIKLLTVLDKLAQDGHSDVTPEVGMLNGTVALLGHANHRNNLTCHFIIRSGINQKHSHLCSDQGPMTRLLFEDVHHPSHFSTITLPSYLPCSSLIRLPFFHPFLSPQTINPINCRKDKNKIIKVLVFCRALHQSDYQILTSGNSPWLTG